MLTKTPTPLDFSQVAEICAECFQSIRTERLLSRLADSDVLVNILIENGTAYAVCVSDATSLLLVAVIPRYRNLFHAARLVERAEQHARICGNTLEFDARLADGSLETFISNTLAAECGFVIQC